MKYKHHKQYRLPGHDYSSFGDYFITICTKNRVEHFGTITKTETEATIDLSPIGLFTLESIAEIPETYNKVTLGETIVMPNHIHLIITLPDKKTEHDSSIKSSDLQKSIAPYNGLHSLIPGSVSSIINHLKGKVKIWANANDLSHFEWQARFNDRIIRDIKAYNNISNYIANNIWNWNGDENNPSGDNFRKEITP